MEEPDGYFLELAEVAQGDAVVRDLDPTHGPGWLHYSQPSSLLVANSPDEVAGVLEAASQFAESGGYCAGFVAYESAPALCPGASSHRLAGVPHAWFALYENAPRRYRELAPVEEDIPIGDLASEIDRAEFGEAFQKIKHALAAGDTYQVNFTFKVRFSLADSATRFFSSRCGTRPPAYAAFLHGGDWQVASFSPELFFERTDDRVETRPMKGTLGCGNGARADDLREDPKSVAENIMIVDMARNDLGRVCEVGSVRASELLRVERVGGLLQMTSTVEGRFSGPTPDLFRALFPAASITGAPKIAATHQIRDLERSPRGIYCGAIGTMSSGHQRFSVAIRTAWIDSNQKRGEFGVGSGLVWDSDEESEWQECLLKRESLLTTPPAWRLVEAFARRDAHCPEIVSLHLARMKRSAHRLGIPWNEDALRLQLENLDSCGASANEKVRIELDRRGEFRISSGPSQITKPILTARVGKIPVGSRDPNLQIKTNSRAVYDGQLEANSDFDEVLLVTEDGRLCEFCRGNLVLEIGGEQLSPDLACGCLPGTEVAQRVARGEMRYASLTESDLSRASAAYLANSVVGLVPVEFSELCE